jgi:hypothetical protein
MLDTARPDLAEMVPANATPSRFSRLLDCGEQQRDQNANDGDNDQQLHEREASG